MYSLCIEICVENADNINRQKYDDIFETDSGVPFSDSYFWDLAEERDAVQTIYRQKTGGLKMKIRIKRGRYSGFSLVEFIVVLVVLAIFAIIILPSFIGHIERAKNHQYMLEAKELMTATQAGIAEAYAFNHASFCNAIRPSECAQVKEDYGYYTNYALYEASKGRKMTVSAKSAENGVGAKNIISQRVVEYADTCKYGFYPSFDNKGQKVSALGDEVGFTILFNKKGKIVFMQYARDNRLVTYDGVTYKVETGKNLKFEAVRNK